MVATISEKINSRWFWEEKNICRWTLWLIFGNWNMEWVQRALIYWYNNGLVIRELILIGFMQFLMTMICNNVLSIRFQTFGTKLYVRLTVKFLNEFVLSFHFCETETNNEKSKMSLHWKYTSSSSSSTTKSSITADVIAPRGTNISTIPRQFGNIFVDMVSHFVEFF